MVSKLVCQDASRTGWVKQAEVLSVGFFHALVIFQ